jgi:hypothetical protein
MSLSDYKPTAAERRAIIAGLNIIEDIADKGMGHWFQVEQHIKQERTGCGISPDRVPLICAQGMFCKWFLHGAENPNMLLRNTWSLRPAAVFAYGMAADRAAYENAKELWKVGVVNTLRDAANAHEAAFARALKQEA